MLVKSRLAAAVARDKISILQKDSQRTHTLLFDIETVTSSSGKGSLVTCHLLAKSVWMYIVKYVYRANGTLGCGSWVGTFGLALLEHLCLHGVPIWLYVYVAHMQFGRPLNTLSESYMEEERTKT